jgi:hypothetical protein
LGSERESMKAGVIQALVLVGAAGAANQALAGSLAVEGFVHPGKHRDAGAGALLRPRVNETLPLLVVALEFLGPRLGVGGDAREPGCSRSTRLRERAAERRRLLSQRQRGTLAVELQQLTQTIDALSRQIMGRTPQF